MFDIRRRTTRAGLVTAAVIGFAIVPTAVMAANSGGSNVLGPTVAAQTAQQTNPHTAQLDNVATALNVTPAQLTAAEQAARTSVGRPAAGTFKDATARATYETNYYAAVATNLNTAAGTSLTGPTVQAAFQANQPQRGTAGGSFGAQTLGKVATALNVTPAQLTAAEQAARTSVGRPAAGTLKDATARATYETNYYAAVATNLNTAAGTSLTGPTVQAAFQANQSQRGTPGQHSGRSNHRGRNGASNGQAPGSSTSGT